MSAPFTKNASDPAQVKEAGRRERFNEKTEVTDLQVVLSTREGRRFLWRLIGECGTFASVWENSSKIHYYSGQQDIGHKLIVDITKANERAWLEMQRESFEDSRKEV